MSKVLTAQGINSLLRVTPASRREVPDGRVRGLYFIQQPSGKASWAVRYRSKADGKPVKLTLGAWPALDLVNARAKAMAALAAVETGEDPASEKRRAKEEAKATKSASLDRIDSVVETFIVRHAQAKNRSWAETDRILKKEVLSIWSGRSLSSISRAEVHDLLDGIVDRGAPVMANRVLAALRRLCNWAIERGIIETSPCSGIKAPSSERSRDRILDDTELAAVWQASEKLGWPFGPIVQLLILTGARREEVAAMRWNEIDLEQKLWTLPASRAKNGKEHVIPLSPQAIAILEALPRIKSGKHLVFTVTGETAVSGFTRAKERIDAFLPEGIPHWTLHDLRRTLASGCARLGVAPQVVEAILNHKSGTIRGVAAVYNRYTYETEKRAAMYAWANHVNAAVI
ncbi:tyrosine-type recombinase/integrase [Beijerinckia mobilis]|uniref:tyrosine-type recombinase/integrase n=1 Tax=Beijerinckia mobilis TaxID=231434 RepID=UPI000554FB85|nr:site-specific integrase [Beijerinckia mobilis]